MFNFSRLEQGTVEVWDIGKCLLNRFIALMWFTCQYAEEYAVQIVKVFNFLCVQKGIGSVATMVFDQLGFKQFQEEYPVNPCN